MFEVLDASFKTLILNGFTPFAIFLTVLLIFSFGFACGFLTNRYFGAKPFWFEKEFICFLEDENGKEFKVDANVLFKNAKIARVNCPLFKNGKCKGEHKCLILEKRV